MASAGPGPAAFAGGGWTGGFAEPVLGITVATDPRGERAFGAFDLGGALAPVAPGGATVALAEGSVPVEPRGSTGPDTFGGEEVAPRGATPATTSFALAFAEDSPEADDAGADGAAFERIEPGTSR